MILSIDPGSRSVGAALFTSDGVLHRAGVVLAPHEGETGPREAAEIAQAVREWVRSSNVSVNKLVLEYPQIYSRGGDKTKGDPNLLLPLAAVDGALAALFYPVEVKYFTPHEWKGSLPKPERASEPYVITTRVMERLSPEERSRIDWPKNKRHGWDVSDSIGVGLHALGRFDKKRVIHRE